MKPLAYLVSSHFSYSMLTLPKLLPSMRRAGIPRENIFVIVCGCRRDFDMAGPDCTFWFVRHESRNFCTFVEAVNPARDLSRFDHVFCLLDTCEAGPRFGKLSADFDRSLDAVAAHPLMEERLAMSDIGAYSLAHLRSQAGLIDTFCDAEIQVNYDFEGKMFGLAERRAFYGGDGGRKIYADPADIYGTGTLRITEHYTAVDLFKFKSNWGQNRDAAGNVVLKDRI